MLNRMSALARNHHLNSHQELGFVTLNCLGDGFPAFWPSHQNPSPYAASARQGLHWSCCRPISANCLRWREAGRRTWKDCGPSFQRLTVICGSSPNAWLIATVTQMMTAVSAGAVSQRADLPSWSSRISKMSGIRLRRINHPFSCPGDMADFEIFEGTKESEYLKQVDYHRDHDNRVQDIFDLGIHGNVGTYEPEEHSSNDQHADDINQRHENSLLFVRG